MSKLNTITQARQEMKRVYDRFVKHGYAHPVVWDETGQDLHVSFTESGERLRRDILTIFDLPDTPFEQLGKDTPIAFWLLMITPTPPPREGGIHV